MMKKNKPNKAERLRQFFDDNRYNYYVKGEMIKDASKVAGTSKSYADLIFNQWILDNMANSNFSTESEEGPVWQIRCSNGRISQKFYFDDSKLFER